MLAMGIAFRRFMSLRLALAFNDLSALALLNMDGLVPSIVVQHAVSRDSFRRSVSFATGQFLINTCLWGTHVVISHKQQVLRVILASLLLLSAGLLPAMLLVATLTGVFATRVRLHSRTHTAAFVFYSCIVASWMLSFALRVTQLKTDMTGVVVAAFSSAFFALGLQMLLPFATHKTLVADTKFWRGLGRYNANARFRDGLRLSELCVQRTSSQTTMACGEGARRIQERALSSDDEEATTRAASETRLVAESHTASADSSRHSSVPTTRRRPEMGLEVASAELQDVIEKAYRYKCMLEFEHLTIDAQVMGKGTTAFVYHGQYKAESVAVKVFNPSEITEEYVAQFGKEIRLMARLRHRNILRLYGLCVRPPQICAVFELCEAGSLAKAMEAAVRAGSWDAESRLNNAFDCSSAVAYLHGAAVWHRDIKLDNFLVAQNGTVKLCDFGESLRRTTAASRGDVATRSQRRSPPESQMSTISSQSSLGPSATTASSTFAFSLREVDDESGGERRKATLFSRVAGRLSRGQSSAGSTASSDVASAASARPPTVRSTPAFSRSPKLMGRFAARDEAPDDDAALDIVGTVAYMAPELIAAHREYTEAVDVFALGIVLRCLWTAEADPWPRDVQTFQIYERVARGERPSLGEDCPPAFAAVVHKAWADDPSDRPDAESLRFAIVQALEALCGPEALDRLRHRVVASPGLKNHTSHRSGRTTTLVERLLFPSRSHFNAKDLPEDVPPSPESTRGGVDRTANPCSTVTWTEAA